MLFNNQQLTEEIKKEIKICIETNENENTTTQNLFSSVQLLSHVQLFVTPWTIARQVPLSMGFPKQEYCCGLPCSPSGDLPNPEIKP